MSSLLRAWYVFLALAFSTFILTAFVGQPPYALSSAVAPPSRIFYQVGSSLSGTLVSLLDRRNLRRDNALLQERADRLAAQNRELSLQLERLEQLAEVRGTQSTAARLSAPVAEVSASTLLRRLSLGVGAEGGVVRDMPVTTAAGLVGIVTDVGPRSALVRAVTDPESAVGVTVRGRGGQGVAVGVPGGLIRVIHFDAEDMVEPGDVVETSSRGGLFPRGITLGTVREVPVRDANSLRLEFVVEPAVDVSKLMDVVLLEPL